MPRAKTKTRKPKKTRKSLATIGTVKRLIGSTQEHKFYQRHVAGSAISTTGAGEDLSAHIVQGDTDSMREGDNLTLTKVRMFGTIEVADTTNLMRVILFRYKPVATPTWAELLEGGTPALADIYRPYRKDTASLFHICYDRVFTLSTVSKPQVSFQKIIYGKKLGKKKVSYNGGGTTGADHLWLFILSDSGAVSHPTITYNVTQYYTDS